MFKWNEEKINILKMYYPLGDFETLYKLLGKENEKSIKSKAKKLHLKYRRQLSEDDINVIKNNYNKIPIEELSKLLNVANSTIYGVMNKYNLSNRYQWTEERIKLLHEYYPLGDWDLLFEKLETNDKPAIISKASSLKIKMESYFFSDEEIKYLNDNYLIKSVKTMSKDLNKTECSISSKLSKLGLIKVFSWSEEELKTLKKEYPYYSNQYIHDNFLKNRDAKNINTMAHKLNLRKIKGAMQKFDKDGLLNDLKQLSLELGRTPLIEELFSHDIASSKTYERYFGGYRQACIGAGLDINISSYGNNVCYLSKNKDICFSKSELIITNFLIDSNINYKKEFSYKDVVADTRCTTKKMDWFLDDKIIVEFWGFPKEGSYKANMDQKRAICRDYNITLIEIFSKDIRNLSKVFRDFIN
jgi:hypothetical protein